MATAHLHALRVRERLPSAIAALVRDGTGIAPAIPARSYQRACVNLATLPDQTTQDRCVAARFENNRLVRRSQGRNVRSSSSDVHRPADLRKLPFGHAADPTVH